MRKLTDRQKATLLHWTDPALRRDPTYETVAKRAGLAGRAVTQDTLEALQRWGYLDADRRLTRKGHNLIRKLRRDQ